MRKQTEMTWLPAPRQTPKERKQQQHTVPGELSARYAAVRVGTGA